jgi:hypothetical protein
VRKVPTGRRRFKPKDKHSRLISKRDWWVNPAAGTSGSSPLSHSRIGVWIQWPEPIDRIVWPIGSDGEKILGEPPKRPPAKASEQLLKMDWTVVRPFLGLSRKNVFADSQLRSKNFPTKFKVIFNATFYTNLIKTFPFLRVSRKLFLLILLCEEFWFERNELKFLHFLTFSSDFKYLNQNLRILWSLSRLFIVPQLVRWIIAWTL